MTIIPSPSSSEAGEDEAQSLYTALSACADLHPDPPSTADGDDDDAFWNADDGDDPLGLEQIDERGVGYLAYPAGSDGDDGGVTALPPPMPGSGGWITAENVGEFFDEEGQVRGGGRLGDGAGRVRGRRDDDGEEEGAEGGHEGVNGDGVEGDETKWRRTG